MLVEVCCNSLESALNAQKAGADRIELCAELGVGGITPSFGLIQAVTEQLSIPVHVLLRPRSGHFAYSDTEFNVLLKDLEHCKQVGVAGVVSGVLHTDGRLDEERTKLLVAAAKPLHFSFHRAFDWIPDKQEALRQLEAMGVDTVLSSGGAVTAEKGMPQLLELCANTKKIQLMPGAGITTDNALKFKGSGFKAIHFSGTGFTSRLPNLPEPSFNSDKHLAEHQVAVTNEALVRQIVQIVK